MTIQKYFKIIENSSSRDLFVFYEMLVWGIKQGMYDYVVDMVERAFKPIINDAVRNQRI